MLAPYPDDDLTISNMSNDVPHFGGVARAGLPFETPTSHPVALPEDGFHRR
jgi:hypothetical protein